MDFPLPLYDQEELLALLDDAPEEMPLAYRAKGGSLNVLVYETLVTAPQPHVPESDSPP